MRIVVDRSLCSGMGMCEAEAPEVFALQDDGHLLVRGEQPESDVLEAVEAAMVACPTQALSLVEE